MAQNLTPQSRVNGHSYPRAIVHVDGDAFFASCEVARDPSLRGKPVVVGGLRGIAVALTYEAKARGVVRGMPVYQIKKLCPSVVILPGAYEFYEQIARRMYAIARRYTDVVEEYSIDECFAEVFEDPEMVASQIKHTLESELGVSFSVGLATTKVLAKVASKHNKPSGLVCIPAGTERQYLENLTVGKVWGIGPATASMLNRAGIVTAQQFVDQPEWWVSENLAKPHRAIWSELRGVSIYDINVDAQTANKSIASTRTFKPSTADRASIFSQLSKNIEEACRRARAQGLRARHIYCFLKSQEFQYLRFEVMLHAPTNIPSEVLNAVRPLFEKEFRHGVEYRATGVTLSGVCATSVTQGDLFGADLKAESGGRVYDVLDAIADKYGKHTLHLASSMTALRGHIALDERLPLPYLGEVR
jgi:nucleotidyltransferase/DNA polymerase involved in DNA repair